MKLSHSGILYIVPTPIGNLLDITYRALKILKKVDAIAVESIQHTNILLKHFDIKNTLILLNKHNEHTQSENIIEKLKKGAIIALVSNAGTPNINDPGHILIVRCRACNITIVPLPGACAAITALSASGISTNRFCYEGFLPIKKKARCDLLNSLKEETRTIIFYESKYRIINSIKDIIEQIDKHRHIVIAREITKKWECIYGTQASLMLTWLQQEQHRHKGEFVIIIDGFKKKYVSLSKKVLNTFLMLREHCSLKQAVLITSKIHNIKKNNLYEYAVKKTT
ncbi:MAG: 16S rRNA (cytidine(1402)-2'-O)-methyltransferase [Buchnera aphidicola (Pentalonia nigronervosa)]|jgi:16S rRNA (cytidine1402-2'-O)-methyltransferase|uniref:Ribosomal RNA small subunit methyltransferase I n=1 Tax=Buchnera aphidicola (Pentalonia nigronervosa) TaxID=1309793 RepID=A0A7H1AZC8_9GAMM|nr:MAG: 16S rRNA (cytidine(1402)-2'-O)-methyltransferase [Buchnera aphidicola (Pentalonia nigronervosa)]